MPLESTQFPENRSRKVGGATVDSLLQRLGDGNWKRGGRTKVANGQTGSQGMRERLVHETKRWCDRERL